MTLVMQWSGMFQGAFKHQVLKQGTNDVFYLKRADFQLPVPPLPALEVPADLVPDLREVYGVDAEGTVYFVGREDLDAPFGDNRARCFANVGYGEAPDSGVPLAHELGHPFYGNIALAPHGEIVVVSNLPSFIVFDAKGVKKWDISDCEKDPALFPGPEGVAPFWQVGAGDVVCGPTSLLVGGLPLNRIDQFDYAGRLIRSIRLFTFEGRDYDLGRSRVARVGFDREGRILAASASHLFVFSQEGQPEAVVVAEEVDVRGGRASFHLWIGVDAQGRLWTEYYKGKEVAYGAFGLP